MGLTFEQVWAALMENREQFKETDARFKKTEALIKELAESSKETDAQIKELAESSKETGAQMKETEALIKELAESTKATDAQMKKTDARIRAIHEELGGISNSNGAFAEEYFRNVVNEKRTFAGHCFDDIGINVRRKCDGKEGEFDIVLYNTVVVALIEVKYKAQAGDLEKMAEKYADSFRGLYPQYEKHKIILGIASLSYDEYTIAKAEELGMVVVRQRGDIIEAETAYLREY
jgi:hypothetical protein